MATQDQNLAQQEHFPNQLDVGPMTEKSRKAQLHFLQEIQSSNDFGQSEKKAAECDSVKKLDTFLKDWKLSQENFDRRQQSGFRRFLRAYQHAGVSVERYIKDFQPFIGILQTFLPPPANTAVGATVGIIAVLCVVAYSKEMIERRLASTMSGVMTQLPGIKLYQEIYNEQDDLSKSLQVSVVKAYSSFAQFATEVSRYYKGRGIALWWRALREPRSLKLKAEEVQKYLAAIQSQCGVLIHKKIDRIEKLNKRLQESDDWHRLDLIQQLLDLGTFSEDDRNKEVERYRARLVYNFDPVRAEPMDDQAFARFETHEVYQAWERAHEPRLLILSAKNRDIHDTQCWLSPVATKLIQKLRPADEKIFLSYYLISQASENPERLVGNIMRVVLFQLLRANSQALREHGKYDELCSAIRKYQQFCDGSAKEDDMGGSDRFSSLDNVVSWVLAFFDETTTVYIIMDRVDQCRLKEQDHRKRLMRTLVHMVEEARCKLKILAVVNKADWAVEEDRYDLDDKRRGRVIIHTAEQRGRYNGVDL